MLGHHGGGAAVAQQRGLLMRQPLRWRCRLPAPGAWRWQSGEPNGLPLRQSRIIRRPEPQGLAQDYCGQPDGHIRLLANHCRRQKPMSKSIRSFGFPESVRVLSLFRTDDGIKSHARYVAAKAGNHEAALDLIVDLALPWLFELQDKFEHPCIFVAPHAKEVSGDNAIPQTLAAVCSAVFSGSVDTTIVQTDRVYHTGADPMERMATRAQFVGKVQPGARYVLVDDVTSLGGTLAELANYIQCGGGIIQDVVVLVNAGRNPALVPLPKNVQLLNRRFGNEIFNIFGIKPEALTANEAQYLVGFRSIDEIRNRLAAARQEIYRRLCAKGITRAPEG
ncbi:MAG: hypothetical protein RIS48_2204, partial [Pseudomonadota bacterium]